MHADNCFITLTFDQEHLDKRVNPQSLDVTEYQRFMKRLRKRFGNNIRFFHCGEYGDKNKRPHYHAIIFGLDFADKELFQVRDSIRLYTSKALQELWPYGFSTIGDVTFQSAAYVARYIMKKHKGEGSEDHYTRWCPSTGEGTLVEPEYCTMSRRPGIGKSWLEKYKSDVYPNDYIVVNGHKVNPPRYYDSLLSEEELAEVKKKRIENAPEVIKDYGEAMDRLWVAQEIKLKKLELLIRNL